MIVQCEKCHSKFNLDDTLFNRKNVKFKCSECKHIFVPSSAELLRGKPVPSPEPAPETDELFAENFDESIDIDKVNIAEVNIEEEIDTADKDVFFETKTEENNFFNEVLEDVSIEEDMSGRHHNTSNILIITLIILILIAGSAAGIFFLAPQYIPDQIRTLIKFDQISAVKDDGTKNLTFKGLAGSFVEPEKTGIILVIRGQVVNNYKDARKAIRLKARILDDKGLVINTKYCFAGNVFTDEEIKKTPLNDIESALIKPVNNDQEDLMVEPGKSIEFMFIFSSLPDNLGEFDVKFMSSEAVKDK